MEIYNFHPKDLYTNILQKIETLFEVVEFEDSKVELKEAESKAKEKLSVIQGNLNSSLLSLEKNSEWDVFTIAFYGETNAGKSTLIETLRILLNESSKTQERNLFKMNYKLFQQLNSERKLLEDKIKASDSILEQQKLDKKENITIYTQKKKNIETTLIHSVTYMFGLNNLMYEEITNSTIKLIRSMIGKLTVQIELKSVKFQINILEKQIHALTQIINAEIMTEPDSQIIKENQTLRKHKELVNSDIEEAKQNLFRLQDGKIVGDGRSDFTQSVEAYSFERESVKFTLLDLPGIEGKEEIVQNEINSSVEKAHAVFYVSSKPTPPQKGNDEHSGTIFKIKEQLSSQTEVYFIYNKRVKNPRQLVHPLISNEEENSLVTVDKIMTETLQNRYSKHISLSAYPALLSVGKTWDEKMIKAKNKFLDRFESETILQRSGVQDFSSWLISDFVRETKLKILTSNLNKVNYSLSNTIVYIKEIIIVFDDLEKKLKENQKLLEREISSILQNFDNKLSNGISKVTRKFKNNLRRSIYNEIKKEIDNTKFEEVLVEKTVIESEKLGKELEKAINELSEELSKAISRISNKYNQRSNEIMGAYFEKKIGNFQFDFDINIETGSETDFKNFIKSLAPTIAGIIISLINPVSWPLLVISLLNNMLRLGKLIYGYLNTKYRSSEQKNTTDKYLDDLQQLIKKEINSKLPDISKNLHEKVNSIYKITRYPVEQIETIKDVIITKQDELVNIQNMLKEGPKTWKQ